MPAMRGGGHHTPRRNRYTQLQTARTAHTAMSKPFSRDDSSTDRHRRRTTQQAASSANHPAQTTANAVASGWTRNAPHRSPASSADNARVPPHVRQGTPVNRWNRHTRAPHRCRAVTRRPIRRTAPRSASRRRISSGSALRNPIRMILPPPATQRCVCQTAHRPERNALPPAAPGRAARPA